MDHPKKTKMTALKVHQAKQEMSNKRQQTPSTTLPVLKQDPATTIPSKEKYN